MWCSAILDQIYQDGSLAMVKKQDRKKLTLAQGFPDGRVWSLGREDPLEDGVATHSSILAWKIPWTEEPGGPKSIECQRVGHDWSAWRACSSCLLLWDRAAVLVHLWHVINKSLSAVVQYRFIAHSWFCELAESVLFGMNPWTWSRFAKNVLTHWVPLCVGVTWLNGPLSDHTQLPK